MPVALAACGRFGYEPRPGSSDDAGVVGGSTVRVSNAAGASLRPALAWTGDDLLVVWDDARDGGSDVYLSRIATSGAVEVDSVPLTREPTEEAYPSVAWSGDELLVAWEDNRDGNTEIYAGRFDGDGAQLAALRVSTTAAPSFDPSVVWTGSGYGIAFDDGGETASDIFVARLDAAGAPQGEPVQRSTDPRRSARASLAWSGSGFGVAWEDTRGGAGDPFFATMTASAEPVSAEVRVSDGNTSAEAVSLASADGEYGLAWEDNRTGSYAIYFIRVDTGGAPQGEEIRVSTGSGNARNASLVWTGDGYGLVWDQAGSIQMALLDEVGDVLMPATTIGGGDRASLPSLVWTGSAFAVAWNDNSAGDQEIYLRVVTP